MRYLFIVKMVLNPRNKSNGAFRSRGRNFGELEAVVCGMIDGKVNKEYWTSGDIAAPSYDLINSLAFKFWVGIFALKYILNHSSCLVPKVKDRGGRFDDMV